MANGRRIRLPLLRVFVWPINCVGKTSRNWKLETRNGIQEKITARREKASFRLHVGKVGERDGIFLMSGNIKLTIVRFRFYSLVYLFSAIRNAGVPRLLCISNLR